MNYNFICIRIMAILVILKLVPCEKSFVRNFCLVIAVSWERSQYNGTGQTQSQDYPSLPQSCFLGLPSRRPIQEQAIIFFLNSQVKEICDPLHDSYLEIIEIQQSFIFVIRVSSYLFSTLHPARENKPINTGCST